QAKARMRVRHRRGWHLTGKWEAKRESRKGRGQEPAPCVPNFSLVNSQVSEPAFIEFMNSRDVAAVDSVFAQRSFDCHNRSDQRSQNLNQGVCIGSKTPGQREDRVRNGAAQ